MTLEQRAPIGDANEGWDAPNRLGELDRSRMRPDLIPVILRWLSYLEMHASTDLPQMWAENPVRLVRRSDVEMLLEAILTAPVKQ